MGTLLVESKAIFYLLSVSFLTLMVVLILHTGITSAARALRLSVSDGVSSVVLFVLIACAPIVMWVGMNVLPLAGRELSPIPVIAKMGTVFLYLSGCVVYIELRSLLSRGYSIRILADLLDRGGSADAEILQLEYGGGLGVEGLLKKRIGTLARLGLFYFKDGRVGPLTLFGKVFGGLGSWVRNLLCLKTVG
jgi:hypothetical protein